MTRTKSLLLNAALILGSIIVAALLAEFALHLTPLKWKYLYPLNMSHEYFRWDPVLGYDIIANMGTTTHEFSDLSYKAWSNDLGCYDEPFDGSSPSIYLAGDSFSWGYTALPEKWGKVIERSTDTRLLNCGVPGYGTRQELIKAARVVDKLQVAPKLFILAHYEDDAGDDAEFPDYTAYHGYVVPAWSSCDPKFMLAYPPLYATSTCTIAKPDYPLLAQIKAELAAHSILYLIAKRQLRIPDMMRSVLTVVAPDWLKAQGLTHDNQEKFENRSQFFDDTTYWEVHFSNIDAFKRYADQQGAYFLVVLIPTKDQAMGTSTAPDSANGRTIAHLKERGIPYLDLQPILHAADPDANVAYWKTDIHWTPAGNALAGQAVTQFIERYGLLR